MQIPVWLFWATLPFSVLGVLTFVFGVIVSIYMLWAALSPEPRALAEYKSCGYGCGLHDEVVSRLHGK